MPPPTWSLNGNKSYDPFHFPGTIPWFLILSVWFLHPCLPQGDICHFEIHLSPGSRAEVWHGLWPDPWKTAPWFVTVAGMMELEYNVQTCIWFHSKLNVATEFFKNWCRLWVSLLLSLLRKQWGGQTLFVSLLADNYLIVRHWNPLSGQT